MPRDTNITPDDDNALPNNKQEALHTAHADDQRVGGAVFLCATCSERPARPGKIRCQECLDAEWLRLRASDPDWYNRHKDYHRHG